MYPVQDNEFTFQLEDSGLLSTSLLTVELAVSSKVQECYGISLRENLSRQGPVSSLWANVGTVLPGNFVYCLSKFIPVWWLPPFTPIDVPGKNGESTHRLWRTFLFMWQRKTEVISREARAPQSKLFWLVLAFLKSWQSRSGSQSNIYRSTRSEHFIPCCTVAPRAVAFTYLQGQGYPENDCSGTGCLFQATDT